MIFQYVVKTVKVILYAVNVYCLVQIINGNEEYPILNKIFFFITLLFLILNELKKEKVNEKES